MSLSVPQLTCKVEIQIQPFDQLYGGWSAVPLPGLGGRGEGNVMSTFNTLEPVCAHGVGGCYSCGSRVMAGELPASITPSHPFLPVTTCLSCF